MSTTVTYIGAGDDGVYVIPFPYLKRDHVKCYVDGILNSNTAWVSSTQLRVIPTPLVTATVLFQRITQKTPIVSFADDARLDKKNLDLAIRQGNYIAEEASEGGQVSAERAEAAATEAAINAAVVAAALGVGGVGFYSTFAAANAVVGAIPANQVVEILNDETRGGARTRYQKVGAALVFSANFDNLTTFAFGSLPTPVAGARIVVSGEATGLATAWSDGTYWRRVSDGRICQSRAVNYFINGTTGSDLSVGTVIGSPIRTMTQLKALVEALPVHRRAGLRFAFARGTSIEGFWFLGAEHGGCIFEAYGTESLARPRFDCSDVVANASFTATPGQANCYNTTITPTIQSLPTEVPGVWVNGVRFSYVASQALCNAHPGTFTHPSAAGATSLVITVNSGTNPAVDGKAYVMAMRSCAIDAVAAPEVVMTDLWGLRNYGSYGSFALGNDAIARRLLVEDGNSHNIFYGAGSVLTDVAALNCNHGVVGNATMFIGFNNPVVPGARAELIRCTARITENSLKPRSPIVALNASSPFTAQVLANHSFTVGDHVLLEGVGGAVWTRGVRWYVSAVAGAVLTLQAHSYATNRVVNFDSRLLAAWTSGGEVRLAPTAQQNVVGFYVHGPGTGAAADMWDNVRYDKCEVQGCSVAFSAADCRITAVDDPRVDQFFIAYDQAAFGTMKVRGGRAENTPSVVGATSSRTAANARMEIEETAFVINSTGTHTLTGAGGELLLHSVRHEGIVSLVRGLAANHRVSLSRVTNAVNANLSQSLYYNFGAAATGLSLTSDANDWGGYTGTILVDNVSHANLAAFQAATGRDANSRP